MKIYPLLLLLLSLAIAESQRRSRIDDGEGDVDNDEDTGTVKSKPVIIQLPKNQNQPPEIHSISSLKKPQEFRANEDSESPSITETPNVIERPRFTPPKPPAPDATPVPLAAPAVAGPSPPAPSPARLPTSQLQLPPASSVSSALAAGSGLSGILANNPSLLKLLQGIGGPAGLGGSGAGAGSGLPPGLSSALGQGGLLAPVQGSSPSLGQPPPFPGSAALGAGPPGSPQSGLINVISSLGRQLGGAVGLSNAIPAAGNSPPIGPSIPRISGLGGPPIAGIPNIPGLPVFPGSITPGGQLDVLQLVSAVSRRALNGSSVTDVLPPNQVQKIADNLTNVLLPETPTIDLNKYMGRWFEGIGSPRASDQRCVVHHYGGLTENGKTATYTALKIYREASEFGQVRYSIGYAFRGGRQPGMLQMHTSESTDPVPYWIYRVGPIGKDPFGNEQYEYAIVSNWIKYPVMVLVRDPDQFKREHEEGVLKWLEEKGFINGFVRAFNLVQPVSYQNCQYADSTFEIFG